MHPLPESAEQRYRRAHPGVVRIYDASLDEFRDATQDDMDRAMVAALHGATIREQANVLHDEWVSKFVTAKCGELR